MTSVQEYFEEAFPSVVSYFSEYDLGELDGMPLDSNCGKHCKRAIDRGKAFDDLIQEGHGMFYTCYERSTKEIAHIVVDLCNLYIGG